MGSVNNFCTEDAKETKITSKAERNVIIDVELFKVRIQFFCQFDTLILFIWTDTCELPMVVGPCNSDYLQWFYDRQTDTCQEFNYGGCQGNDNRFSDQESCERRCRKSEIPVTYAPPFQHVQTHAPVEEGIYLHNLLLQNILRLFR